MDIVAAHEQGVSPAELQDYFDTRPLTLGEIHAALAYYNDHKDEVEADFAEAERIAAEGAERSRASSSSPSGIGSRPVVS